jgi:hypothetical protein
MMETSRAARHARIGADAHAAAAGRQPCVPGRGRHRGACRDAVDVRALRNPAGGGGADGAAPLGRDRRGASLGAALGAALLYLVFHHLGWARLFDAYPDVVRSSAWSNATRWLSAYGVVALLVIAATPLPLTRR